MTAKLLPRLLSGRLLALVLAVTASGAACEGLIGETDGEAREGGKDGVDPDVPETALLASKSGLRRLSVDEYDTTLADLIGDASRPGAALLPNDGRSPFDNDYAGQIASQALIEGAEKLASEAAARLVADPARRDAVVGCAPAGPDDAACFQDFVARFGRLAFRRSLTAEEREGYAGLLALGVEAGDFYAAVEVAVAAMLQDPNFLYRVEIGEDVGGGFRRLDGVEMASRLSYLLWGSSPDAALLDEAEGGGLTDPASVRAAATRLLEDDRARVRVARFHALWLGYETLNVDGTLEEAMQAESRALVERVVFDESRPWQDLLRSDETWVTPELAAHYGLPAPSGAAGWVKYGDDGRQGLLAHATFLSNGAKVTDTSPTLRGLAVRTRLFCQEIPPPPPNVDPDAGPQGEGTCKTEKYAQHRSDPGCAGCHSQMDPIGFGLERFDQQGRYRTVEAEHPECAIDGQGEIADVGAFSGPKGLADLMLADGAVNACVVKQFYRFAVGRGVLDGDDEAFVAHLSDALGTGDFRFDALLLEYVSTPAFGYRQEEE